MSLVPLFLAGLRWSVSLALFGAAVSAGSARHRRAIVGCLSTLCALSGNACGTEREINDLVDGELARMVAAEVQDEPDAKENRAYRVQTYVAYTHATRKDLFVFFVLEGYGGGDGYEIHLALFARPGGKAKADRKSVV